MKNAIHEALLLLLAAAVSTSLAAADMTGVWSIDFEADTGGPSYQGECAFKQEGTRLAGSCSGNPPGTAPLPLTGDVQGRTVTFRYRTGLGEGATVTFSGELDETETSLKGSWRFVDANGNQGQGTFTAQKE